MTLRSVGWLILGVTVGGFALFVGQGHAQERRGGQEGQQFQMPDLVGPMRQIEGCLGVETAVSSSGKRIIFAWFEDKAAVRRWYNSEAHQGAMKAFSDDPAYREPLSGIAADAGPILVMASITLTDEPKFEGINFPISQIAIELYTPLPGGAYVGERFAPASVQVDGMMDYTER